jgi:NADPH:quinone reductase
MRAAWYEKQGAARDVLTIGEMDDPQPRAREVRIRVAFSGINPGDVKKREDAFGFGMPYARVIPHSDGSGTVDLVGEGVPRDWVGRRVWCYGAQSYRPFGTAAQGRMSGIERSFSRYRAQTNGGAGHVRRASGHDVLSRS